MGEEEVVLFNREEAAEYLGVKLTTLKKHIYVLKDLVPDKVLPRGLVFTKATLDAFQAGRKKAGRPPRQTD